MKYIQDKTKLIYARQLAKNNNSISELDWLRLRIVFVFNIVFIACLIPPICVAFLSSNFIASVIGLIIIPFLAFSNILIIKGYIKYPIFISVLILPSLGFTIAFLNVVPYQAMFAQLCLILALTIWIINDYRARIFYAIINLSFLFWLYSSHNSLEDTIPAMFVISGCIVVFQFVTLFHEKQDRQLFNSLQDQKILNTTLVKKNDKLQTFSHIMSHDLKAPLTTIRSFSKLIKQKVTFEDESHKQYFSFIENSAEEMKTLIDELLLYHKLESEVQDFATVNLNKVVDAISSTYQYDILQNKIKFISTPLPEIKGNYILLKALFGNLISNSIKYQPKEKANHIPQIEVWSATDRADYIDIYISDNGIGIDEGYIKNLFQPFKRFHSNQEYEGTGLGMSICKSVIEKHLGSIELHESSENGTTFKLSFPKMPTANKMTNGVQREYKQEKALRQ